jgi:hypothetical protein
MTKEEKKEYYKNYLLNNEKYRKHRKEYMKKYRKTYNINNKEKVKLEHRKVKLKKLYGITIEQYDQLLSNQNGCCAICKKSQTQFKRKLHVDHNHITGQVRGLVCVSCNSGIACFERDKLFFDKVKEYLNKYNLTEKCQGTINIFGS